MNIIGKSRIGAKTKPAADVEKLRRLRVETARRVEAWREVAATDFVQRPPYLVEAESDWVFVPFKGTIYATGEAKPTYHERTALLFVVGENDELTFFERTANPQTWSQHVARRAHRARVTA